jgi:hypothetical protein
VADYKLIPEPLPSAGARAGIYAEIVANFAGMKEQSVRVEYARKPNVVYAGLKNALRRNPEYKGIVVSRRGDAVFLVRKK